MKKQKISDSLRGKRSRASGQRFEAKVRENLESMDWIVSKWMNTIDYEKNKIVPAKRKYNPFFKALSVGTGFPDFIAFKPTIYPKGDDPACLNSGPKGFEVIGVEVKKKGYLDKIEKGMCLWLIENKIFNKILIAKAKKNGRKIEIEYIDFKDKYLK